MRSTFFVFAAFLAVGCTSDETVGEMCDPRAAGPASFTDATEAWGLGKSGLAVTGNRISAADLDGDGYPDLVIRPIRVNLREKVGQAPKLVWVLMNRPGANGGRTFVDATVDSGLYAVRGGDGSELHSTHVVVMADVDNDGDLDAFGGTYVDSNHPETDPGDRSQMLMNDGTGHFSIAPDSALSAWGDELRATTGASFADVDRDGKLDLLVGFFYQFYGKTLDGYQAELYRGAGDGTFSQITHDVGLTTNGDISTFDNPRPSYGVTACDLDDDGAPELMIGAYGRQLNLQYHNDGHGRFAEVGRTTGYAQDDDFDYADDWTFICSCKALGGSLDDPKCPAATTAAMNVCTSLGGLRGAWQPGFSDQPYRLGGVNFTTVCADLDGDGKLDLYNTTDRHWDVGSAADPSQLLSNTSTPGTLSLRRVPNAESGIMKVQPEFNWNEGWLHAAAMDFDNDGLLDLLVGATDYPDNVGLLFRHGADHRFSEIGQAAGLQHACLSGLAVADFDRDGDLDVVVGSGTARDCGKLWATNEVHLYESHAAEGAGWIELRLRGDGKTSNASAIGAKVTVRAGGQAMVRDVSAGYGHMAIQNDPIVHVGLGACDGAQSIEVRWPDAQGTVDTFLRVRGRRLVELRQGSSDVMTLISRELPPR